MKKVRWFGVIAGLLLSFLLAAVPGAQAKKIYVAYISIAPGPSGVYWVAQDAGIFKKNGLNVELLFIRGSTRGIQSLIAGDLGFASAVGTAVINGRLAGGNIVIISSLMNTLPYYIIGKPTIKSPQDLKGKTAAVHIPGTAADFALRLALRRVGLSYRDIKAVTLGGGPARIAAAISGQVDFTIGSEAQEIPGVKAGLRVIMNMAKLDIPFQYTCATTTEKMIRQSPDTVQRFVRSLVEGVHFFKTHKAETVRIMGKYAREKRPSVLDSVYDAYKNLLVKDTHPTMKGLKDTLELMAQRDPRAARARAGEFVDLRFVEQLKKSGFIDRLYGRR